MVMIWTWQCQIFLKHGTVSKEILIHAYLIYFNLWYLLIVYSNLLNPEHFRFFQSCIAIQQRGLTQWIYRLPGTLSKMLTLQKIYIKICIFCFLLFFLMYVTWIQKIYSLQRSTFLKRSVWFSYVGFDKTNTANLFYSCLIQKVVFNKWNVLLEKNLLH